MMVFTSVYDIRTESPTSKMFEFNTDKEVLPDCAAAERLVKAVCT
jgi:hypothetical protein